MADPLSDSTSSAQPQLAGRRGSVLCAIWVLLMSFVMVSFAQAHEAFSFAPQSTASEVAAIADAVPLNAPDDRSCPDGNDLRGDCCMTGASCHAMAAITGPSVEPLPLAQTHIRAGTRGLVSGEIVPLLPPPRS
jgi:hypothetical protein